MPSLFNLERTLWAAYGYYRERYRMMAAITIAAA